MNKKSHPPLSKKLFFFSGPTEAGAQDKLEDIVIQFIDGSRHRLFIAVQELGSLPVTKAIIRARQRKVCVKIVLEQDYLRSYRLHSHPFRSNGENETNRYLHNALLRSNIDVKTDYNTGIFHQKFMIRDSESVLTGSANFTHTDLHRNLNHLLVIHDTSIAAIYLKEFAEIQQGRFGRLKKGLPCLPPDGMLGKVRVKVLFAPVHNPEMEIMKQMMKAKHSILFAIFTFALSSGIDDTMFRLLELGIPIRGVFDANQGGHPWSALVPLRQKGAGLWSVPMGDKVGKLHHKLMVIDERLIIAGSFNYTSDANRINDENIVILGDLDGRLPGQREAERKLGQQASAEIERIIKQNAVKITDTG